MCSASFTAEPYFIRLQRFLWLSCRSPSSTASIPGTSRNVWSSILISNSISPIISTYHKLAIVHLHVLYTIISQKWKRDIYSTLMTICLQYSVMLHMKSTIFTMIAIAIRKEWQCCWSCATRQSTAPVSIKPRSIKATCIISSDRSDLLLLADSGCWMHVSYHCSTKTISACWSAQINSQTWVRLLDWNGSCLALNLQI